jgi:hypothetical protein
VTGPDRRDIKINVTVDSDTRGSDQAAASLEKVDKSAGGAEKGLADLKKESASLDAQLAKTRTKVKELEQELVRTADRTTGKGTLRSRLNQERSWLRELEKLASNSASMMPKLDFSGAFASAKGPAIGALVGIAAASAPMIASIVSGAVAGTTVGGGIAGGIIAASSDSRVRQAFRDLTSEFTAEAFGAGAFVAPVVDGLHILKDEFRNLDIDEALAKGASSVPILAQGIADLVKNIMPGFNDVMDQAESFTRVFADGLGDTGSALSSLLSDVVESEGSLEGLHAGFVLLSGTIIATGNTLKWLGDRFHDSNVAGAKFTGGLEDVAHWVQVVGSLGLNQGGSRIENDLRSMNDGLEDILAVTPEANEAIAEFQRIIRETTDPTESQADALKKLNDEFERGIDLQAAYITDQLDVEEGLQNLADQFAENGTDLSMFTEEGQKNQRALVALAKEMRQVRDDQIALGGSVADANAVLAANYERLLQQAEAANISRAAVEALIGALFAVPNVTASFNLTRPLDESGEVKGKRAGGGPVSMGGAYLVGEGGPELFVPNSNGYVVPNGGSGGGMGWGGGGTVRLEVGGTPSSGIEALFMQWLGNALAKYVSTVGLGDGGIIGVRTVSG